MTMHKGFTLNAQTGAARLNALRQRRDHIENTIQQLHDQLYIIDAEIVEIGGLTS